MFSNCLVPGHYFKYMKAKKRANFCNTLLEISTFLIIVSLIPDIICFIIVFIMCSGTNNIATVDFITRLSIIWTSL